MFVCHPYVHYFIFVSDIRRRRLLRAGVEGPPVNFAGQHDPRVPPTSGRMASPHLAPGLLLQERQEGHLPDDDHSQPLRLALQGQDDSLHGQVSPNFEAEFQGSQLISGR